MSLISGFKNRTIGLQFVILTLLLLLFFLADLLMGSVIVPFKQIILAFLSPAEADETYRTIILDFRFPKALTAVLTGAALSLSGLQMQTVFRNPLAGPYVLGISAGASLGVALFVLGFSSSLAWGLFSSAGALYNRKPAHGSRHRLQIVSPSSGHRFTDLYK